MRWLTPSSVARGHVASAGEPSNDSGSSPRALDMSGTDATMTSPSCRATASRPLDHHVAEHTRRLPTQSSSSPASLTGSRFDDPAGRRHTRSVPLGSTTARSRSSSPSSSPMRIATWHFGGGAPSVCMINSNAPSLDRPGAGGGDAATIAIGTGVSPSPPLPPYLHSPTAHVHTARRVTGVVPGWVEECASPAIGLEEGASPATANTRLLSVHAQPCTLRITPAPLLTPDPSSPRPGRRTVRTLPDPDPSLACCVM